MMGFAFKKPQEIKFGILALEESAAQEVLGGCCLQEGFVALGRRQMSSNVILTSNTPHTDYLWAELVEVLSSLLLSTMQG